MSTKAVVNFDTLGDSASSFVIVAIAGSFNATIIKDLAVLTIEAFKQDSKYHSV